MSLLKMTIDYYAIHDAWFYSLNDGDVDDRAAIKFYEKMIEKNPEIKIMVYFTDERFNISKSYFNNSNITICEKFNINDVMISDKVGVFAKIKDENIRSDLVKILTEKKNGYCQGNQIGSYNFPDDNYLALLNSMTYKFSTDFTNICFTEKFLDSLDSEYKNDYLVYGLLKLIAIGGIINFPGLVYRLYCPKIGGGPGTNMLKIQNWFKLIIPELNNITIDSYNFKIVNDIILNETITDKVLNLNEFKPLNMFMKKAEEMKTVKIGDKIVDIDLEELKKSLKVMIIFGNIIYKPKNENFLFNLETDKFYTLTNMPLGDLMISPEETPPLYDLVAAYCILNDIYSNEPTEQESIKSKLIEFFN
jgi:hypothetical protein